MKETNMEYNSARPHLIISEYGRHIQKMIEHACSLKDREERNKMARGIIQVMGQLNPHLRDVADFKHKLWDHLFIMSDYKLDVDSPYPKPEAETFKTKPERVSYPNPNMKYRHYGKTMEAIINKAKNWPEGDEKNYLTTLIANHMKRAYLTWNRDSVNDEVIINQMEEMSDGKLKLSDPSKLSNTNDILRSAKSGSSNEPRSNDRHGGHRHRDNRHKGGKNFKHKRK